MNIASFYTLRDRLYACAAAGCAAVNEDFRLRRALEEFAPLAQSNKVFARIHMLCGKLFETENAAPVLAECIALADAVAVTQGSFADGCEICETKMHSDISAPKNIPYSEISALCEKISKCSPKLAELGVKDYPLLRDSRVLAAFISACGSSSIYLDEFAEYMFDIYGNELIPLLKNSIDFSNPKENGTRIEYISLIAGNEENEYFISIAEDEHAPQNVRIAAIKALGGRNENASRLAAFYKTQKGKIKNAALTALARTDCPEAEEIFAKLIENFKPSYAEYIDKSRSKVCTDFAIKKVKDYNRDKAAGNLLKKLQNMDGSDCYFLMGDKPFADMAFILLAENGSNAEFLSKQLINNLYNNSFADEYKELIHRLYRKMPSHFTPAEFFVRLIESPDTAFLQAETEMKNTPDDIITILEGIYYNDIIGKYCIYRKYSGIMTKYPRTVISDSLPDGMLEFICSENYDAEHRASLLRSLMEKCSPNDRETIKTAAVEYALRVIDKEPADAVMRIIAHFFKDGAPEFYRGLLTKYVMHMLNMPRYRYRHIDFMDDFPLSQEEKNAEVSALIEKLEKTKDNHTLTGDTNKTADINSMKAYLTTYLNQHQ